MFNNIVTSTDLALPHRSVPLRCPVHRVQVHQEDQGEWRDGRVGLGRDSDFNARNIFSSSEASTQIFSPVDSSQAKSSRRHPATALSVAYSTACFRFRESRRPSSTRHDPARLAISSFPHDCNRCAHLHRFLFSMGILGLFTSTTPSVRHIVLDRGLISPRFASLCYICNFAFRSSHMSRALLISALGSVWRDVLSDYASLEDTYDEQGWTSSRWSPKL